MSAGNLKRSIQECDFCHFGFYSLKFYYVVVTGYHLRIVDLVYLDHAGATLYSESQMEAVFKDLTTTVYGNPRILF